MASLHYSPGYFKNSPTNVMRINNTQNAENHHYNGGSYQNPQHYHSEGKPAFNQLSPLQKLQINIREKFRKEKMMELQKKWAEDTRMTPKSKNHQAMNLINEDSHSRSNSIRGRTKDSNHYMSRNQSIYSSSSHFRREITKPQKLPPLNHVPKSHSYHEEEPSKSRSASGSSQKHRLTKANRYKPPIQEQRVTFNDNFNKDGEISPPPNIQQLRVLRERKIQQDRIRKEEEREALYHENIENNFKNKKMSEFERWQQERDAEKMARLQRHGELQHNSSDKIQRNTPNQDINLKLKVDYGQQRRKIIPNEQQQKKSRKLQRMNHSFKTAPNAVKSELPAPPRPSAESKDSPKRQEVLRQKIKEKEIEKLKEELRQKQNELKQIQRDRLDSCGHSGSENESEYEIEFQEQKPVLKPVRVTKLPPRQAKKQKPTNNHKESRYMVSEDEVDNKSDAAFQMKPVLVRRDGSGQGNKATIKQKSQLTAARVKHEIKNPIESNHSKMSKVTRNNAEPQFTRKWEEDYHGSHSNAATHQDYPVIDEDPENSEFIKLIVVPCGICGRKFTEERLSQHTRVCAKTTHKKRKVFNMTKMRVKGTEIEEFTRQHSLRSATPPKKKKLDWRTKHENFIKTIRDAKTYQNHIANGGKASDLPPPPPADNPDYVQCKYCARKFAPAVAERHIPKCKDIKSRPRPPKRW